MTMLTQSTGLSRGKGYSHAIVEIDKETGAFICIRAAFTTNNKAMIFLDRHRREPGLAYEIHKNKIM